MVELFLGNQERVVGNLFAVPVVSVEIERDGVRQLDREKATGGWLHLEAEDVSHEVRALTVVASDDHQVVQFDGHSREIARVGYA